MVNHRKNVIATAVDRVMQQVDRLESQAGVGSRTLTVSVRFTEARDNMPPRAHAVANVKLAVFADARADEIIRNGDDAAFEPVLTR